MRRDALAPTISRRQFLTSIGAGGTLLLSPGLSPAPDSGLLAGAQRERPAVDNVVLLWNEAAPQGVRHSRLGPPMVARALAILHTGAYDAWAAYDHQAVGTRLGRALRRPPSERTLANKETAISFAAYRASVDLFPGDRASVFDPLMRRLGHNPGDTTTDARTPSGVGNLAAQAVLEFRHRDGANQLGDEPGGVPGISYSDCTGYASSNNPMDLRANFDPATVQGYNRKLWIEVGVRSVAYPPV